MKEIRDRRMPFAGVAIALILGGAAIATIGAVAWKLSAYWNMATISSPFEKVIGGVIILALGYILLELELLRDK